MEFGLMTFTSLAVLSLAVIFSTSALADQDLATKNQCMACHALNKKVLGPAYQEIAKKYQGTPDAQAKLTESIRKGGAGKWGQIPMPAQPNLSEADAKALAIWVLSTAK
jgi:cytochrome c